MSCGGHNSSQNKDERQKWLISDYHNLSMTPSTPPTVLGWKGWASIFLWMILGYCMILFNKVLFSSMNFAYPFFLTCWHCVFASIATQVLSRTTNLMPGVKDAKVTVTVLFTKILPLSMFSALGLVSGNTAYKYLSVAYIQMIKSMTPVMMLVIAFAIGREQVSTLQLAIVLLISSGVAIASAGELNFSLIGFGLQLFAMCSDVCRITLLETVLGDFKLDSLSMLYYLSPSSAFLIALGFYVKEFPSFPFERLDPLFCFVLLVNAAMAFALNISIMLLLANASGMIMSIAGLAKDIIVVVSSSVFFKAPVTFVQYVGYSITVMGMFIYKEFKKDPAALQAWIHHHLFRHLVFLSPSLSGPLSPASKAKYSGDDLSEAVGSNGATHAYGDHEAALPYDAQVTPAHGHLQQRATRRDASQVEKAGSHSVVVVSHPGGEGGHGRARVCSMSGRDLTTASSGGSNSNSSTGGNSFISSGSSGSNGGSDENDGGESGGSSHATTAQDYVGLDRAYLQPVFAAASAQAQAQALSATAGWGWSALSLMEMAGLSGSGGSGSGSGGHGDAATPLLARDAE